MSLNVMSNKWNCLLVKIGSQAIKVTLLANYTHVLNVV